MERYAAGIVLYNPDIKRLKENLDAVCGQVEWVYCYNNGLRNAGEINALLNTYGNIRVIGTGTNVGIATALNELTKEAEKDNIEWILTLDQDSVVCDGMVEALASFKNEKDVAIICPVIEDIRRKNETPAVAQNTIDDVEFCITSGSFMNIQKTLEIGGFDEWLFIGLVDNEICYRIKLNGYRIIRNNSVILNHELGNLTSSKFESVYLKLGNALHSKTIQKLSYRRTVSSMRLYYATRNMIYLNIKYPNQNNAWSKKQLILNSLSSVLRGKNKAVLVKSILRGIKDGKTSTEKYEVSQ